MKKLKRRLISSLGNVPRKELEITEIIDIIEDILIINMYPWVKEGKADAWEEEEIRKVTSKTAKEILETIDKIRNMNV